MGTEKKEKTTLSRQPQVEWRGILGRCANFDVAAAVTVMWLELKMVSV